MGISDHPVYKFHFLKAEKIKPKNALKENSPDKNYTIPIKLPKAATYQLICLKFCKFCRVELHYDTKISDKVVASVPKILDITS